MSKLGISIRLENDLVKLIDAKITKTKNRSDVIAELLYTALAKSNDQKDDQTELFKKGARASIMLLRVAELALRQHSSHADDIFKKALPRYQKEVKGSELEEMLDPS
jgi:metal-responsive CopG/Arc/MetJ family transcriptional regulator